MVYYSLSATGNTVHKAGVQHRTSLTPLHRKFTNLRKVSPQTIQFECAVAQIWSLLTERGASTQSMLDRTLSEIQMVWTDDIKLQELSMYVCTIFISSC